MAENEKSGMDGTTKDIQGWIDCFEGVSLKEVVYGIGVHDVGEIENTIVHTKAYELGESI